MNASAAGAAAGKPTVTLVDSGYGQSESVVQAIVIVTNDSEAAIGESVTVSVNFLDADGKIVATEEQVESFNWVGQQLVLPVTHFAESESVRVTSIEPSVSLSAYGVTHPAMDPLPVLKASEIKKAEFGGYTASFAFTNETNSDLKDLRVGVACYDKANHIIGGTSEYPSLAPAGKTIRIEADPIVPGKPASCKAFVNYDVF